MKRTMTSIKLLSAATLVAVMAACAASDETATDSAVGATPAGDSAGAASGMLLDPNTATRDQLAALPGMDAATADTLVARRPFSNMLAVDSILAPKLSEAQRDTIYERMFAPLDLNTATKDEIMLIPGVGERMHHEFEEYRPYTDIARFRREIAKYVDDTTVARYERYVMIR